MGGGKQFVVVRSKRKEAFNSGQFWVFLPKLLFQTGFQDRDYLKELLSVLKAIVRKGA